MVLGVSSPLLADDRGQNSNSLPQSLASELGVQDSVTVVPDSSDPRRARLISLGLKFGLTFAAVAIPLQLTAPQNLAANLTVSGVMGGLSTVEFNFMEVVSKWRSQPGWILKGDGPENLENAPTKEVLTRFLQSNFKEFLLGFAWLFTAHLLQVSQSVETFALLAVLDSAWKALVSEGSWRLTYSAVAGHLSKTFPQSSSKIWNGARGVDIVVTTLITSLNMINLTREGGISTVVYGAGAIGVVAFAGVHFVQSRTCGRFLGKLKLETR